MKAGRWKRTCQQWSDFSQLLMLLCPSSISTIGSLPLKGQIYPWDYKAAVAQLITTEFEKTFSKATDTTIE